MEYAVTQWVPEHFIGGHPALDLANAVFDRRVPGPGNELLGSPRDIGNWLVAAGLVSGRAATAVARIEAEPFVGRVHAVREAAAQLFGAIAAGRTPDAQSLGVLLTTAGSGLSASTMRLDDTGPRLTLARWRDPNAVTAFLALLAVEAFYTLPRDRLRSCPRCAWLFLDSSRGGKRRWCSMQICGNREKVSRHREQVR
ncbi:hypothetical protein NBRGN_002_00050 [Nocardia brasiliensis NBRC 14402]|uniref:CGNR zinc finger domain-containing protein n=1 Tax=Nocardia brasiliensis TaxID=37326 RepID=UPI0002FC53D7|nr:ABATE domain-containing protein [Nocardia brasiliensis]AVL26284.1 hypothetical protein CEQ30_07100 [Nocardia brasiliensis]GAJ79112.1 hypothetical protein NBRGN_002_00050 [Nocardia brasiliensis NBRC 14402]